MRIPLKLRVLLVLAGLACLIGSALLMRERANSTVRPPSGAVVSGDLSVTVVRH